MILEPGFELVLSEPPDAICELHGELDAANAHRLISAVDALVSADAHGVLVDVTDLTFIDSSGVAALLHCRQRCADLGVPMRLTEPHHRTARMFELTGLDRLFGLGASANARS